MLTAPEATKILMLIQAAFPQYKIQSKEIALELWQMAFSDMDAETVTRAVKAFILTDTKGFAPSVGQIRDLACEKPQSEILTEGEAWGLVYNALTNANYHAEEEFNKLPADARRAVGGPEQLRAWAVMDKENITVAESNFKRTYRALAQKRQDMARLPLEMQPKLEAAPVAAIETQQPRWKPEGNKPPEWVTGKIAEMMEE